MLGQNSVLTSSIMRRELKKFVNNVSFLVLVGILIIPISQYSSFAQQPPSEQPPSVQQPPSEQPPLADQPPSLDQPPSIEKPPLADQLASSEQPTLTQQPSGQQKSGGCLIATATYGSELAPQVQLLREIRDNTVLSTASGISFMSAFNSFYYSFSPAVADLERQNPMFKETVKVAITPLITTLSVLNYVDIDSEEELVGYGIGVILLNFGMYFVIPALIITKISRFNRK